MRILIIFFIFAFFPFQISVAQNKNSEAEKTFKKGLQLAEDGYIDKGLMFLEEAMEMDPDNLYYAYEVAYIYTVLDKHGDAIDILEPLAKRKDTFDLVFQLLGNNYDWDGNPEKAIKTYNAGLKLFPNSGKLYLELGNMANMKKDYLKAISLYEKGIMVEPYFPSNYYNAGSLHLAFGDKFLGLMYSEIFMNLERKSKRTVEASKGIFNFYKESFKVKYDESTDKKNIVINYNPTYDSISKKDSIKSKSIFSGFMFFIFLTSVLKEENAIDYESVCRIRQNTLNEYFEKNMDKENYNAVFEWQKNLMDKGLFEAYNHWILSQSDVAGFKSWMNNNQLKMDEFVNWFENKSIPLEGKDGKLFIR